MIRAIFRASVIQLVRERGAGSRKYGAIRARIYGSLYRPNETEFQRARARAVLTGRYYSAARVLRHNAERAARVVVKRGTTDRRGVFFFNSLFC